MTGPGAGDAQAGTAAAPTADPAARLAATWARRLDSYKLLVVRGAHLVERHDVGMAVGCLLVACWLFATFWTSTRTVLNQLCLIAAVFPALQVSQNA